uniref:Uncharacterized protein n=1 Tax=Ananas comosus var. bracteatus TaxID=296719 RepID=A0A6V7NEY5_ANACO|nr:unnamed protein product [Ananas comosus var. bracteatus]
MQTSIAVGIPTTICFIRGVQFIRKFGLGFCSGLNLDMDFHNPSGEGVNNIMNDQVEGRSPEIAAKDPSNKDGDALKSIGYNYTVANNGKVTRENIAAENEDDVGDVNMEAAIKADNVIRAGGFGARDDISSFLPAAIDSTDFEASLRDARDFEEEQAETSRPGLGWTKSVD